MADTRCFCIRPAKDFSRRLRVFQNEVLRTKFVPETKTQDN
jgi:hypothetical protein